MFILLINGIPVVQIELKTYDVSPRRAMQQIVLKSEYKNVTIPINIILYIESVDNYVKVHLADDSSCSPRFPCVAWRNSFLRESSSASTAPSWWHATASPVSRTRK